MPQAMPKPAPLPLSLPIKRLPHAMGLPLPRHETEGAACVDLIAAVTEDIVLQHGARTGVPTGICFAIPAGYHGQIWGRSGLAAKQGIAILGGMIDCDYRGELKVLLLNTGNEPFTISRGMRIAQFLIAPYARIEAFEVEELPDTARGAGGFGSTGS